MYKTLLIFKYLRKRRIAWVSLLAVTLCTTMVIVVMSVMSGWLAMFRESSRGLTGDIVIQRRSWSGFPHYQEIIDKAQALAEVKAAVPTIETFGLVNIVNQIRVGVQVVGYPIEKVGLVNRFPQSLYRQYGAATDPAATPAEREAAKALATQPPSFNPPLDPELYRAMLPGAGDGESKRDFDAAGLPGMIVGSGVIGLRKDAAGNMIHDLDTALRSWVKLTVMGIDDESTPDFQGRTERRYWIVDDSRTRVYEQDQRTVYVPFDRLQKDLRMDGDTYTDAVTGQKIIEPARTTKIEVAVKPDVDPATVVPKIQAIVDEIMTRHGYPYARDRVTAMTWEELRQDYINAIEREIVLLTLLFSIISIVAVFLIFCIFYMIVAEKTRDIGIIKSVGATGGGVASIFLGYGLAIGVIGGGMGLLISFLIVHHINEIHAWMGRQLNVQVWDPKTYMFDTIPNTLDPSKVWIIVAVAIVSSVAGSMIPAWRAARMNPVEALRWE